MKEIKGESGVTLIKVLFLILLLISLLAQLACSSLSASQPPDRQDRALTNMTCQDPFVLKLILVSKQWYIEVRGSRHRLSRAGDALRPIMEMRKSKAVLVLAPKYVKYKVLQQFADYARAAGITCINGPYIIK